MKCLIIDVVHEAIAQELGKYMEVKVSEKLPPRQGRAEGHDRGCGRADHAR